MLTHKVRPGLFFGLILLALAAPALARGDKVVPQVADGPGFVTKFDLVNTSSTQPITKYKLRFFQQNGNPWTIQTTLGSGSEFVLTINALQKVHIETLGASPTLTSGYAVFRDDETITSYGAKDLALGITAYYVTTSGGTATGVVSVPASDSTEAFSLPVDVDDSAGTYTGIAIANLAGAGNSITLNLYASTDSPTNAPPATSITLQTNQQRAEFLHQNIFPGLTKFKGLLQGLASGPVSVLGLEQISTKSGPQYASITPTLTDHLRQNSDILVIEPEVSWTTQYMPIELDDLRVDYFQYELQNEGLSWDLQYESRSMGKRQLRAVHGAGLVPLDNSQHKYANPDNFDAVSLADLRALNYSTTAAVDFTNVSNSNYGDSYAVRTNLGNYAKLRLVRVIVTVDASNNQTIDLGFDVYVFK